MLTYKKTDNNTTLIFDKDTQVGTIEIRQDKFIIGLCEYTITIPVKRRQAVKQCLENHYKAILEMREWETESELTAMRRGFTIKK